MKQLLKILIVDDEIDFLASMQRALRKEPYQVLIADNGSKALQMIRCQDISVVISDYRMPEMDGLALIKAIRLDYPHILVIMLTAVSEIEVALKAINEAGIYKFLLKPVKILELREMLRRTLETLESGGAQKADLHHAKSREVILQELERQEPGITKVAKDCLGYVIS